MTEHSLSCEPKALKRWCAIHQQLLVQHYPGIKQYGFCIISTTYSTTKWALKVSSTRNEKIKVAMNGDAESVVSGGGLVAWAETKTFGGWNYCPDEEDEGGVLGLNAWLDWASGWVDWWYEREPRERKEAREWAVIVDGVFFKYGSLRAKALGVSWQFFRYKVASLLMMDRSR